MRLDELFESEKIRKQKEASQKMRSLFKRNWDYYYEHLEDSLKIRQEKDLKETEKEIAKDELSFFSKRDLQEQEKSFQKSRKEKVINEVFSIGKEELIKLLWKGVKYAYNYLIEKIFKLGSIEVQKEEFLRKFEESQIETFKSVREHYENINIDLNEKDRQLVDKNFTGKFSTEILKEHNLFAAEYLPKLYPIPFANYYTNKFFVQFEFPFGVSNDDLIMLSSTIRKVGGIGKLSLEFDKIQDYSNFFSFNELYANLKKFTQSSSGDLVFKNPIAISKFNYNDYKVLSRTGYFIWKKYFELISDLKFTSENQNYLSPIPLSALNSSFAINIYLFSDLICHNSIERISYEPGYPTEDVILEYKGSENVKEKVAYEFKILNFKVLAIPTELSNIELNYSTSKTVDYTVKVQYLYFDAKEWPIRYTYDRIQSRIIDIVVPEELKLQYLSFDTLKFPTIIFTLFNLFNMARILDVQRFLRFPLKL